MAWRDDLALLRSYVLEQPARNALARVGAELERLTSQVKFCPYCAGAFVPESAGYEGPCAGCKRAERLERERDYALRERATGIRDAIEGTRQANLEAARLRDGLRRLRESLRIEPYHGVKYKILCLTCGGLSTQPPRNHDDSHGWPCDACEGLGVRPALLAAIREADALLSAEPGRQEPEHPDPSSHGGHPYTPTERAMGYGTPSDPRFAGGQEKQPSDPVKGKT